jgi:hypothetical protein
MPNPSRRPGCSNSSGWGCWMMTGGLGLGNDHTADSGMWVFFRRVRPELKGCIGTLTRLHQSTDSQGSEST